MLARWLALVAVVVATLTTGIARAAERLPHERYSLDNGLDVILHVDRTLPLVAVDLGYHVGSMHDGTQSGLAHLVEHLMFRGTSDLGDGELNDRLLEAGAQGTNAVTQYGLTSYHTLVPADQLPLALWLEANRMAYLLPAMKDDKVAQEIQTTVDEWEYRVQSERDGPGFVAMWEILFPEGHPFHLSTPEQIRRLRPDDARAFVRRYHGPANATLVLAGDLPDDVREQVSHYFGRRKGGTRPDAPVVTAVPVTEERRIVRRSALSTNPLVLVGWATPGLYEPGDAEADVLADSLNAGRMRARLEELAPDAFLDVYVRQYSRMGQSMFLVAAHGGATAKPEDMLAAIDTVLAEVRQQSLSPADVRRARRRYALDALRGLQRLDHRAAQMLAYVSAGKDPDWVDADLARYEAVDEAAVAVFVRDHLRMDRRVVVLVSPAGAAQ